MYTREQKQLAVDTYLKIHSLRKTIRILGYPGARVTLQQWIEEYKIKGNVTDPKRKPSIPRYSEDDISRAVEYWLSCGMNITKTCNDIGYPCRNVLSKWLDERFPNRSNKSSLKGSSLKKYSYNDKVIASIKLTCRKGSAETLVQETNISRTSLYKWKKQLFLMESA